MTVAAIRFKRRSASRALGLASALMAAGVVHAAGLPGSGQILQEVPPPAVRPPLAQPELKVEQAAPALASASLPFRVDKIEVTGATLLPADMLQALVAPSAGRLFTLPELDELADRITQAYRAKGFLLARAYVPAQTLSDGTVRIAVIEARFGDVVLHNGSGAADRVLDATLAPLRGGQPVAQDSLDRRLLLLSDIPGIETSSVLRPGAAPGTSDLVVNATPGAAYDGNVSLDNAGNRYTGRARVGASLNVNNPSGQGDQFSVSGLSSGSDLNYARLGYQYLLNGEGTRIGGSLSALHYRLGDPVSDLGINGTAQVASVLVSQPLIRGVEGNLYGQLEYDYKQLRDHIDATQTQTDRHVQVLTLSLAGDRHDSSGVSNLGVGFSAGQVAFDNDAAQSVSAAGPRNYGGFAKLGISAARLQELSSATSLYVAFSGQLASSNLDPSEQFILGGPASVRAYDVGAVSGSQGALLTAELRHIVAVTPIGIWQAIAFADSGYVQVYKHTFAGSGANSATISGAGVGLNWFGPDGWRASATLARRVGSVPLFVAEADTWRAWLQLQKTF